MSFADDPWTRLGGAVLGAIAPRLAIGVAGRDRANYLHGLLTNDIQGLAAGRGCYAAWLNAHGRMLTDMHVLESGDMMLLDVPEAEHAATLARLDQYLFSEDVQLTDLSAVLTAVWLHGPQAPQVLERAAPSFTHLSSWDQYQNARGQMGGDLHGTAIVVARIDQLGVPGFCLYVAPADRAAVVDALVAAGAPVGEPGFIERARIEAAYPVFGVDMTDDTIPLEAGIESRAISFTKGCYVGQEVIIRVLHRGQGRVARKLVRLSVQGPAPARLAKVCVGEREVGWVTSAASDAADSSQALAYLQRDFLALDTVVEIDAGGATTSARVVEVVGTAAPSA